MSVWNRSHIFDSANLKTRSGKGSKSGLSTWAWGLTSGTTQSSQLDVDSSDSDFSALHSNVLSSQHGGVWRGLVSVGFDFHTTIIPAATKSSLRFLSLNYYSISPLVDETKDLTRNVLSLGLLVVHDTSRGGQDNVTELSSWQQVSSPSLDVVDLDVESWLDDTTLVESTVQLDNNLSGSVVVNVFEFSNVAVLLHNGEELDDHLGRRSDQDLSLSGLFGVVDGVEGVSQNRGSSHCE
ncbi:hypothetical protein OGAPHI_004824 [Ogataea philodendri]|uniref:Uncharacterized protein n=1 Tax=Ogataea philodendri TaxID=1378263 RepID=A0A9P8P2K3_9ASCO|nr:uncharacterized protein OGAPHI_004824 [Ogataea philodendri]KAH3664110.1 hypothetical protein OGAPHI_004824 [Ogataea philodendri]